MIGRTNADGGGGVTSEETTVTKDKVLAGETYLGVDTDDEVGTGTIPIQTPKNQALGINSFIILPAGYYPSESTITQDITTRGAATITPSTSAQKIAAGQYLSGDQTIASLGGNAPTSMVHPSYTFSSDNAGRAKQGTMATMGAQTVTPGNSTKTVSCSSKYMTGNVTVSAVSNLSAGNIKKGVNVGGVVGNFEGYTTSPLYLFNNGSWSNLQTTGFTSASGNGWVGTPSADATKYDFGSRYNNNKCYFRTNQTIPTSGYSKLKINITSFRNFRGPWYWGISTNPNLDNTSGMTELLGNGVQIINISSGYYYVYVVNIRDGSGPTSESQDIIISQLYLTAV